MSEGKKFLITLQFEHKKHEKINFLPIYTVLTRANCYSEEYVAQFLKNGYYEIESFMNLNQNALIQLGIKNSYHRATILYGLRTVCLENLYNLNGDEKNSPSWNLFSQFLQNYEIEKSIFFVELTLEKLYCKLRSLSPLINQFLIPRTVHIDPELSFFLQKEGKKKKYKIWKRKYCIFYHRKLGDDCIQNLYNLLKLERTCKKVSPIADWLNELVNDEKMEYLLFHSRTCLGRYWIGYLNHFKARQTCRICPKRTHKCCQRCRLVSYCGRKHQKNDWEKTHRYECKKMPVTIRFMLFKIRTFIEGSYCLASGRRFYEMPPVPVAGQKEQEQVLRDTYLSILQTEVNISRHKENTLVNLN